MNKAMSLKAKFKYGLFVIGILIIIAIFVSFFSKQIFSVKDYIDIEKAPVIKPDYSGLIIPPNIAPLNFYIDEHADFYFVKVYSKKSKPINIYSKTSGIRIPLRPWKKLLNENKGNKLYFEIFLNKQNRWQRYTPIVNKIAEEKIDSFLVFRRLIPQYHQKADMKILMRNLENYSQRVIIDQEPLDGCFNCHTFFQKRPEKFIIQARSKGKNYMILSDKGGVSLIAPKFIKPGSVYLSWHPSGNIVALAMNMDYEVFIYLSGSTPEEKLEFFDADADIAIYTIDTNTISTTPDLARKDRMESQPEWSPDGKYLYFISAPKVSLQEYKKVKYNLMRISFDVKTNTWGEPEVVVASKDSGLSAAFPRISPDGRYLLFCMMDHSSFPIFRGSSDIYLMDLHTGKYRKLEINSERADAYRSWSSNSRWFVFISKRGDGIFGKAYFAYIDNNGDVHKPFILPQKDPYFYDTITRSYNVPELISEPVRLNRFSFARKITPDNKIINTRLDKDLLIYEDKDAASIDSFEYGPASDYPH